MEATLERSNEDLKESVVANDPATESGNKFLTFLLAGEVYGIEILKVRELIGIMDITCVPQTQGFVRGVINLRGKVIPVIDLRCKFKMESTPYNDQTCIIVVDTGTAMGIIVDTVQEVHDIPAAEIEEPPKLGASVDTSFVLGLGKVDGVVKILLDIDRVVASEELVLA